MIRKQRPRAPIPVQSKSPHRVAAVHPHRIEYAITPRRASQLFFRPANSNSRFMIKQKTSAKRRGHQIAATKKNLGKKREEGRKKREPPWCTETYCLSYLLYQGKSARMKKTTQTEPTKKCGAWRLVSCVRFHGSECTLPCPYGRTGAYSPVVELSRAGDILVARREA